MGIDGIEFHPCYQQNLGTFREVWFFQNFYSAQIMPPWSNHNLKIQWEIHFLTFLNTDRNTLKNI